MAGRASVPPANQRCFAAGAPAGLLQPESLGVEDGQAQAVCQLLLGAVGGQQQAVEAGVAGGQAVAVRAVALRAGRQGGVGFSARGRSP